MSAVDDDYACFFRSVYDVYVCVVLRLVCEYFDEFLLCFCFCIHTPCHTFVLSDGTSALLLARKPDIIAALRAAGACEEEPEDGEDLDLEQDDEAEEDD